MNIAICISDLWCDVSRCRLVSRICLCVIFDSSNLVAHSQKIQGNVGFRRKGQGCVRDPDRAPKSGEVENGCALHQHPPGPREPFTRQIDLTPYLSYNIEDAFFSHMLLLLLLAGLS